MSLKSLFLNEPKKTKNLGLYADMLEVEGEFNFVLSKDKVTSDTDFKAICDEAENLLTTNLKQLGLLHGDRLYKIPNNLISIGISTSGAIGSMTILTDDDGKLSTRFHRMECGYWDKISKNYPEAKTTGKRKHEIFFPMLLEED